jgi:hypothetical protein
LDNLRGNDPITLNLHLLSFIHRFQAAQGVVDATRESDNKQVFIKRVTADSAELSIAEYLKATRDPANHCVPILDILKPSTLSNSQKQELLIISSKFNSQEFEDEAYIVMPLLRAVDDPPFETVNDVVDLVSQLLEVGKVCIE